ncbi:hypothetical protein ACFPM0_20010 [Pseudonocardia sulfidoxydans]|uniref:hypothetical protein n=1 Tax=Pseudonocardia sulfidoxydans TaxID=54011 RepID=UPI00360EB210
MDDWRCAVGGPSIGRMLRRYKHPNAGPHGSTRRLTRGSGMQLVTSAPPASAPSTAWRPVAAGEARRAP